MRHRCRKEIGVVSRYIVVAAITWTTSMSSFVMAENDAMPVFYYAGVYTGLPAIYYSDADRWILETPLRLKVRVSRSRYVQI